MACFPKSLENARIGERPDLKKGQEHCILSLRNGAEYGTDVLPGF